MTAVEFFYDFTSPYSYLASTWVDEVARRAGGEVRYRPFLLGAVFKATGNHGPLETPAKMAHLKVDLDRWARRLGVPLVFPSAFPVSTVLALRCALAAGRHGQLAPFTHAVFRACWTDGQDIASPEVLGRLAAGVGLPALVSEAPGEKDTLIRETTGAVERGAFGAPTFFVGTEMFVGNDRLDFVEEALRTARGACPPS